MAYAGMCGWTTAGQGMVFYFSVLNRLYNFVESVKKVYPVRLI